MTEFPNELNQNKPRVMIIGEDDQGFEKLEICPVLCESAVKKEVIIIGTEKADTGMGDAVAAVNIFKPFNCLSYEAQWSSQWKNWLVI